jgi:hypothetical protein
MCVYDNMFYTTMFMLYLYLYVLCYMSCICVLIRPKMPFISKLCTNSLHHINVNEMKIFKLNSFNCRGCRNKNNRFKLFVWLKKYHYGINFLQCMFLHVILLLCYICLCMYCLFNVLSEGKFLNILNQLSYDHIKMKLGINYKWTKLIILV